MITPRLYLCETTGKWQYLNSYKDGVITLDTASRYLLTNENLRFASINWTFFIAGGAVLVWSLRWPTSRSRSPLLVLVSRSSSSETKIRRGPSETLKRALLCYNYILVAVLSKGPSLRSSVIPVSSSLFHGHALGEVARFIHVAAAQAPLM